MSGWRRTGSLGAKNSANSFSQTRKTAPRGSADTDRALWRASRTDAAALVPRSLPDMSADCSKSRSIDECRSDAPPRDECRSDAVQPELQALPLTVPMSMQSASATEGHQVGPPRCFVGPGGTVSQRIEALVDGVRSTVGVECADCCKRLSVMLRVGLVAADEVDLAALPAVEQVLTALSIHFEDPEVVRHGLSFLNSFVTASVWTYVRETREVLVHQRASVEARSLLELKEIASIMTMRLSLSDLESVKCWGKERDPTVADAGRRRLLAVSAVRIVVAAMRRYPRHIPIQMQGLALLQAVSFGSDPLCLLGVLASDALAVVSLAAKTLNDVANWTHMLLRGFVTWTIVHLASAGMACRRAVLAADGLELLKTTSLNAIFGPSNLYCGRDVLHRAVCLLEGALKPGATLASCVAWGKTQKRIQNVAMHFALERDRKKNELEKQQGIIRPAKQGREALTLTADDFIGPTDEEMSRATALVQWNELLSDNFLRVSLEVNTGRVKLMLSITPASSRMSKYCALCGVRADAARSLQRCGGCMKMSFCSPQCMKSAWKQRGHKRFCGEPLPSGASIESGSPAHVIASLRLFGRWQIEVALSCLRRVEDSAATDDGQDWTSVGVVNAVAEVMLVQEEVIVQEACVSAMFCLLGSEKRLSDLEASDKCYLGLVLKAAARVLSDCLFEVPAFETRAVSQALAMIKVFSEHSEALREIAIDAGAIEAIVMFISGSPPGAVRSAGSTLELLYTASDGSRCARHHMRARLAATGQRIQLS